MQAGRLRIAALVAGVMAASPAFAYTITVNSKIAAYQDSLVPAVGTVAPAAGSAQTFSDDVTFATPSAFACASNAATDCVKYAPADAIVILEPTVGANTTFVGWSGCTSVSAGLCTVKVTGSRIVTANFKPATYEVRAATSPVKTGTWTPPYGGRLQSGVVDCQTSYATTGPCVGTAPNGAPVVFTAVPVAGSVVTRWAGCTPVDADLVTPGVQLGNECTLTASGPTAVSVAFGGASNGQKLVTARVSGSGVITADDMNCTSNPDTSDCTSVVNSPGTKTYTAVADAGSKLIGWTGCTSSSGNSCTVTNPVANVNITASFKSAACTTCHNITASHGTGVPNCGQCHTGYQTDAVNAALHMNGVIDVISNGVVALPDVGAKIEITGVTVAEGAAPTVTFKLSDSKSNAALAMADFGTLSVTLSKLNADGTYQSYLFSNKAGASYLKNGVSTPPTLASTTQAGSQSISVAGSGTRLVANGGGSYTYTFSAPVTGVNVAQQHTVAIWGTRAVSGYNFRANAFKDFAPNGSAVVTREVVSDAACNACHGQLTLHGSRTGVKSCLTCHSPQTTDPETGNTVDMATMIHKIHNGHLLANDYSIVGYGQSYMNFNHVAMAPSHTGYFTGAGTYLAAHDPGLSRECGICHQGAEASKAYSNPTRRACGACHDDVNFPVDHGGGIAGPQTDDVSCSQCHNAANLQKNHSRFYETVSNTNFVTAVPNFPATGHKFEASIVAIDQDPTTKAVTWTVDFKLDNAAFDMALAKAAASNGGYVLSTCAFQFAGPTSDYTVPATGSTAKSCTAAGFTAVAGTPGRYTFADTVNWFAGKPDGYYTGSFEIMLSRQFGTAPNTILKPFSANPNFLTLKNVGGTATVVTAPAELALGARRGVVSFDKCNACHVDLGFHSNRGRKGPDYCATCHNPKLDNGTRARPTVAEAYLTSATGSQLVYLPESVSMNMFIHRIHMGGALPSVSKKEIATGAAATPSPLAATPGEIVYGATRSAFPGVDAVTAPELANFTEFAMPNTMNRCDQCHIDTGAKKTWALPELPGLAPIERSYRACNSVTPTWASEPVCNVTATSGMPLPTTPVKVVTPPLKAVCTSCHDSAATNAHADIFTITPMTAGATELCAGCHGAGKDFDAQLVHRSVPK
jgi:OmcA/MtrC family decaheme c-type cytochrome